jgi:hypothetical protein
LERNSSTGTTRQKYGREEVWRNYVKLHALVGTKTNVIASATVTDRDRHDYTQFAPLLDEGAKTFTMTEISADKAYMGRSNLAAAAAVGAEPFIPFKNPAYDDPKSPLWSKLYHLYHYRVDEFLVALPPPHQRRVDVLDDETRLHRHAPEQGRGCAAERAAPDGHRAQHPHPRSLHL